MMKIRMLPAVVALGCMLLVQGCATRSMNTVDPAQPEGIPHMVSDSRILTDPSLGRNVYVVGVNDAYTASGFKKVQIQVYNRTRSRKMFTYRIEWFDQEGMQIPSATDTRKPMSIEGGERKSIVETATSPKAADFRFSFLEKMD